ncbi:MAG TPA: hypothetical protein VGE07_03240 [Herpetosiphonaceae bacterium]
MLQNIPFFLAAGAACCVALGWVFPQRRAWGVWARYLFLLATTIIVAVSASFCYAMAHYVLHFDTLSMVAALVFESVILFSIFGMIFNLDYNEMGREIKRRLRRS